ncbi:MAG: universal stress protein UspA [Rhodospirillaceae bacterium]|jgi:nucleotide-binding universal stress UspA family protein|nr:universal stress protein UspA [Rhodospirillaceae bacterium]|tara:strand:- start:1956 stop:2939 length:984 start_codon:yes stop_codon:yes gene_type:complete
MVEWEGAPGLSDEEITARKEHFRILVCIDGSDECYQSLRYAARMGGGVDADIVLLYVRPVDQGLRSGGLQVRVARENMLKWGIELPGIQYLKKGRDMLKELGHMAGEEWREEVMHTDVDGDPLGDNKINYINEQGKMVVLKLKVASDIATGILEQWELGPYDLIILGASGRWKGMARSFWDPAVAEKVAVHAPCSVLVARDLDIGHGHLLCTDGSEKSMEMMRRDAELASRCDCAVSLMSVALDVEGEDEAKENVAKAKEMLEAMGIEVKETLVKVGNPIDEIIEAGPDYSLIVVSESGKTGLQRFFMGSVAFKVMENAHNSVMIVR